MKSTREQESISSSLTRLDRDSWARNEGALIGLIGDKDAKWPLICTREQFTKKKAPDGGEKQVMKAHETWDDAKVAGGSWSKLSYAWSTVHACTSCVRYASTFYVVGGLDSGSSQRRCSRSNFLKVRLHRLEG